MSGATKGGNYIVQSCQTDAEVRRLPRPLPGVTHQCSICGAEYTNISVAKECYEECKKEHPMSAADTPTVVDHAESPRRMPRQLRDFLQVANRLMADAPMPVVRPSIQIGDEEISLDDILHGALNIGESGLEAQKDMAPDGRVQTGCQQPTGSDDVCGLPLNSMVHDFATRSGHHYMAPDTGVERTCTKVEMGEICGDPQPNHHSLTHPFTHPDLECQFRYEDNRQCKLMAEDPIHSGRIQGSGGHEYISAGVAQSAEQGFRKAEAVGSTPISSSMKLNKEQVEALKLIVHYRLQLEDLRKAADDAQKALSTAKRTVADAQRAYDLTVKRVERQGKEFEGLLYDAEASLRRLIIQDVLIKGTPEPAPEPEKPVEIEEHDDLGRAE